MPIFYAGFQVIRSDGSVPARKMLKLCTLTILLLAAVPSHGTTPGTVVRVRQEALEYGKAVTERTGLAPSNCAYLYTLC